MHNKNNKLQGRLQKKKPDCYSVKEITFSVSWAFAVFVFSFQFQRNSFLKIGQNIYRNPSVQTCACISQVNKSRSHFKQATFSVKSRSRSYKPFLPHVWPLLKGKEYLPLLNVRKNQLS